MRNRCFRLLGLLKMGRSAIVGLSALNISPMFLKGSTLNEKYYISYNTKNSEIEHFGRPGGLVALAMQRAGPLRAQTKPPSLTHETAAVYGGFLDNQ